MDVVVCIVVKFKQTIYGDGVDIEWHCLWVNAATVYY